MSALPFPDPSQMPSGRLVIRPQKPVVIMTVFALGVMTAVTAGACLFTGGVTAALICLLVGAAGLYVILGPRIWLDSERVGSHVFLFSRSCAREELDSLRITYRGRSKSCFFVCKDGRVAFRVPAMIFGNQQLAALAACLGVPLYGRV